MNMFRPWFKLLLMPLLIKPAALMIGLNMKRISVWQGCSFAFLLFVSSGAIHSVKAQNAQVAPAVVASEAQPGGKATSREVTLDKNSFSHSSGNLSSKHEFDFKIGKAIFRKLWVSSPASTKSSDGLGPLYNARSCQLCHLKDGRGHPPTANWPDDDAVSMLMRLSIPAQTEKQKSDLANHRSNSIPDPVYGGQLQDFAVHGIASEGHIHISYSPRIVKLADGKTVKLRAPKYSISEPGYGALHAGTMMSPRIANPMIGLGLLDAIDAKDILTYADPDDRNGNGISGRPNQVWNIEARKLALGRFGWKAGQPTIRQQIAKAFAGDIGISSPLVAVPSGDCTSAQIKCMAAPNGENAKIKIPEISKTLFDLVTFYSANLAVPPRRAPYDPQVLKGRELFYSSGCASCHRPDFTTGKLPDQPHLSNQKIWPYSDLLLHDMGKGLADNRPESVADGQEWRTPPLWGIGLTKAVNGHTQFLHDGRARNLLEAILWHGGEAEAAKLEVINMNDDARAALLKFVNSL